MTGEMFLISLAVFPILYFIGYLCDKILYIRDYGRIMRTILRILFFIGVIAHELSHRLVCALTGVPAHNTTVKYRPRPHGSVTPKEPLQYTLLQGFLICFAPLLIGTWLIYFLLMATFNPLFHPISRVITGFSSFSILLTLAPSQADLSCIKRGFQNDPQHGLYQIFLVLLSFIMTWITVVVYHLRFPLEFIYYFIIILFYVLFKYSFILLRISYIRIMFRKGEIPHKIGSKRFARRRYRPKIPDKYQNVEG
jgi:4-hydroxybenzoate polyprenyltransferase